MLEALAIIKLSEFVIVHEFIINFYKPNNSFTEIPTQPLKAVRATLNAIFGALICCIPVLNYQADCTLNNQHYQLL